MRHKFFMFVCYFLLMDKRKLKQEISEFNTAVDKGHHGRLFIDPSDKLTVGFLRSFLLYVNFSDSFLNLLSSYFRTDESEMFCTFCILSASLLFLATSFSQEANVSVLLLLTLILLCNYQTKSPLERTHLRPHLTIIFFIY